MSLVVAAAMLLAWMPQPDPAEAQICGAADQIAGFVSNGGTPVPGATVQVVVPRLNLVATTTSDTLNTGFYHFTGSQLPGIQSGDAVQLIATAPGNLLGRTNTSVFGCPSRIDLFVSVAVPPLPTQIPNNVPPSTAFCFQGFVRNSDVNPAAGVPGATVELRLPRQGLVVSTTSDSQNTGFYGFTAAQLGSIQPNDAFEIRVTAPGGLAGNTSGFFFSCPETNTIFVSAARSPTPTPNPLFALQGIVTNGNVGGPLAGATVTLTAPARNITRTTTTDANGFFGFTAANLAGINNSDVIVLTATGNGLTANESTLFSSPGPQFVTLFATSSPTTTPTPNPFFAVQGIVTNSNTGAPLAGATVTLTAPARNITRTATTDANGFFGFTAASLAGINNGDVIALTATGSGLTANESTTFFSPGPQTVNLFASAGTTTTPTPNPFFAVQGIVTNSNTGAPLAGATVTLTAPARNITRTATTDANGFFGFTAASLAGINNGDVIALTATGSGLTANQSTTFSTFGPQFITLSASASTTTTPTPNPLFAVQGVVTDNNTGNPIAGATVTLTVPARGVTTTATTDASGFFGFTAASLAGVNNGDVIQLTATKGGQTGVSTTTFNSFGPQFVTISVSTTAVSNPADACIQGFVTNSTLGQGVSGATVRLVAPARGLNLTATTDAQGTGFFSFPRAVLNALRSGDAIQISATGAGLGSAVTSTSFSGCPSTVNVSSSTASTPTPVASFCIQGFVIDDLRHVPQPGALVTLTVPGKLLRRAAISDPVSPGFFGFRQVDLPGIAQGDAFVLTASQDGVQIGTVTGTFNSCPATFTINTTLPGMGVGQGVASGVPETVPVPAAAPPAPLLPPVPGQAFPSFNAPPPAATPSPQPADGSAPSSLAPLSDRWLVAVPATAGSLHRAALSGQLAAVRLDGAASHALPPAAAA